MQHGIPARWRWCLHPSRWGQQWATVGYITDESVADHEVIYRGRGLGKRMDDAAARRESEIQFVPNAVEVPVRPALLAIAVLASLIIAGAGVSYRNAEQVHEVTE